MPSLLPVELWLFIACFLSQSDLFCLCLTSSLFLAIFRPILYRAVDLRTIDFIPNVSATFELLARNRRLASRIVELTVGHLNERRMADWWAHSEPDSKAFLNMTSLKRITIEGTFAIQMIRLPTAIEELTYVFCGHSESQFTNELLQPIVQLKKFAWQVSSGSTSIHGSSVRLIRYSNRFP
jgi:hypothetical protein